MLREPPLCFTRKRKDDIFVALSLVWPLNSTFNPDVETTDRIGGLERYQ